MDQLLYPFLVRMRVSKSAPLIALVDWCKQNCDPGAWAGEMDQDQGDYVFGFRSQELAVQLELSN
jgi:hypothetical protein